MVDLGASDWGFSFDELSDMIIAALEQAVEEEGKDSAVVIAHDWGAAMALMVQRRRPDLVKKLILNDVEVSVWDGIYSGNLVLMFIVFGFVYQFILCAAFLIASIPFVGIPIGNWLTRKVTTDQLAPLSQDSAGFERTSVLATYPYLHWHSNMLMEIIGLKKGFDKRHNIQNPSDLPPTLLIYDTDLFHSKLFEQLMRDRPDCDVVKLSPAEKFNHWFIYHHPADVFPIMSNWLATGEKVGKGVYEGDIVGFVSPLQAGIVPRERPLVAQQTSNTKQFDQSAREVKQVRTEIAKADAAQAAILRKLQ